jgi:RND family efflux transporter MFP subunit
VPVADAEVTLSAPLSGNLSLSKPLPHAGSRISKNDVIAVIEPPVSLQGGIGSLTASHAEARSRVVLAQKEYERAQRLYEAKAVPKRRLEEAEIGLESAKAAFEPLDRAVQEVKPGSPGGRVVVRAPFGGTVVELFAANGKAIDGGQPILRLINTSTVWLKASVPATEIGSLGNLDKASFTIPGIEGEMKPSRLVTVNDMVDQKTRTVPVIFEVANNAGKLKVGMFADVSLKTGRAENALTVPAEALIEDEGRYFLVVLKGGESFERREVKTGTRGGVVQVLSGLAKDERVVLRGGYYVKLASLTSRMSDPHASHGH